jgi:hypothetical protein
MISPQTPEGIPMLASRTRHPSPLAVVLALVLVLAIAPLGADVHPGAAEVVTKMIEAHGGMEAWESAPTVAFTEEFRPGEATSGMPGRVVVQQGSRRAYLDYGGAQVAWDGEKAWGVNWQVPTPPRFLALLNYYFLNLPWLTQDPGVNLGAPGTGTLPGDATEYVTVRMTFDAGVGDTPDDYYLLFVHPETHRLAANEYVVTYRSILPAGVESSQPHVLVYSDYTEVGGLVVPTGYTIYEDGAIYATAVFSDWSFSMPWDETWMEMPEGAVVDESEP